MVLIFITFYLTEEIKVMEAVRRRLPQVELMPAQSEENMIEDVLIWRKEGSPLSTEREESCINGFGIVSMNPRELCNKDYVIRRYCF